MLAWWVSAAAAATPPAKGQVCFQQSFDGPDALIGWGGSARLEDGYQSAKAVALEQKDGENRSAMISIPLPVDSLRGCLLTATAMVKAQAVSAKPDSWNGVKFMVSVESPAGKTYPQADLGVGSFDWRQTAFSLRIPADATRATLHLGLEKVSGKAWFDALKVVVVKPPIKPSAVAFWGDGFTGHAVPRLRGAMVSPSSLNEEGLRVLGRDWNANLVRWQLIRGEKPGETMALADYDRWLDRELARLDALLPVCERYGIYVLIDLHSPPGGKGTAGGYAGSDSGLFTDRACQDKLVEVWRRVARKYRGSKAIWGYDLANEPVEDFIAEGCDDWQALAERVAKAIREVDPERAIIVEAPPWGGPDSLADFYPLPVSNVVYSVHMYLPHTFTHQGVFHSGQPVSYPGVIDGKLWDKAALEAALKPTIDFQKRYHVAIYIGEFSAIRWAPGESAYQYLKDAIEVFEAHGWDWSYHAFREWDGWSVEHTGDPKDKARSATETTRQRWLRDVFGKNQKPAW
jgi:endoglucanase